MRKYFSFLFITITLLLFSKTTFSQADINLWFVNKAPVIDGNIDNIWQQFEAKQLSNWLADSPVPDSDFSAWFKSLWDEENLYFIVNVNDDIQINDSPDVWQDDAIEIYLDINNDKLDYYGNTDYQYTFRWNDNQIHTSYPTADIEFVIVQTTSGYLLEVKFPWKTLGLSKAEPSVLLGLDVHVHDDDDGGARDNKLGWFATIDQSWQNPSLFATAQLSGVLVINPTARKPNISVNHGFYDRPFDATISSPVAGMQIYYTLDGTDPSKSATAFVGASPLTVRIDPQSNNQRGVTPAVTLRAAAYKDGYNFSQTVTRTYIFLNEMELQTQFPGHDWPDYNVNGQAIDLLMDQRVLNDPRYKNIMHDALTQIPSISIVTDNEHLFGSSKGIYVNAMQDGEEWERPASIELINPDGSKGFQIDAGLRIRGGYSRNSWFRKHAFRLFFRSEYGEGKLDFPLFENEGVDRFDKIDLRCSQNYSWSKGTEEAWHATYNRDVFSRDIQGLMNQPYTRSRYYHLYLNGLYWGLYQSQERSEARFAESYFGNDKEKYDVVKKGDSGIEATDGNLDAWREIWNITQRGYSNSSNYYQIQGLNENGQRDLTKKVMVDVDNLIDYMNIIFYTGNFDAPVSAWGSNKSPNNFYAIFDRDGTDGFKFFAHDNEHTLLIDAIGPGYGITENRVNIGNITGSNKMTVNSFENFQPQWLHHRLTANEEYRMRFADRAYRHLFNNGVLTPEKAAQVFYNRTLEFNNAIIGESARWGDVDGWTLFTKDDHWLQNINRMMNEYFPYRTNIVIEQLQNEQLLPKILPAEIRQNNKLITDESIEIISGAGFDIRNPNAKGSMFFTIDGSDPRAIGGGISKSAVNAENLYTINFYQSSILKVRVYDGEEWSTLSKLLVNVDQQISTIIFSEIHYNPLAGDGFAGSQYEFIELKNIGNEPVTLTNASFSNGIQFNFNTETILAPGAFLVLASQPITFAMRYGFEPYGKYNGQLDNRGERITLVSATGQEIISVSYHDESPWPSSADGLGFSLVPKYNNSDTDWDNGNNWTASSVINGTPGADDNGADIPVVKVNEILASTDRPQVDAIELFNPNNFSVDISHWYLSDNRSIPQKWQIPAGTVIQANSYLVFYEAYFIDTLKNYRREHFGSAFSLSSHGEEAYLFSANNTGQLTGFEHGFQFDESDEGVSFGQHLTSTGEVHHLPMAELTLGYENSLPKVGPLIFNQIMYHPIDNHFEYLELINISNETISLFDTQTYTGWRVSGVNFNFPPDTYIKPGESVYLTESAIFTEDFRAMKGMHQSIQIFNYPGKLDNAGEKLEIRKPAPSYYNDKDSLIFPYIVIETVRYNDKSPWPDADGNGNVLQRVDQTLYGNDPANWIAAPAGITINNFVMARATQGVQYQHLFTANGGMPPYNWNIESGLLPQGLNLNGVSGTIEGNPTQNGSFTFKLSVTDQFEVNAQTTLLLIVGENTEALAIDDHVKTYQNYNINIDLLQNDVDNDNERNYWPITFTNQPQHGSVIWNNDRTATYIPNKDFIGNDSFTYRINDYSNLSEATVYIEVEPFMITETLEVRVSQASDDAEENIESRQLWTNSSDLELTYDPYPGGEQIVGMRFQNLQIPQGTTINNAYIKFTNDEVSDSETILYIHAEASDNTLTFNENNLISSRQLTSNQVEWAPDPWLLIDETTGKQQTPDLSSLIQEITDRNGWAKGNNMVFIVSGNGTRVAYAYDGDPSKAPLLFVEYGLANAEPQTPIAVASVSGNLLINAAVCVNADESYSPDGRPLNYTWTIVSKPLGSNSVLSNPYLGNPCFTPDKFGNYEIALVVDNGTYSSDEYILSIAIGNTPPIAHAGYDQEKISGENVVLNGSRSYDPEGESITFNWQLISIPQNSNATLLNPSHEQTTLLVDVEGMYQISLVVSDGELSSEPDTVTIRVVGNQLPIAHAGANQQVYTGQMVQLTADQSYDPEERGLTYQWYNISKPAGSQAELTNPTSKSPSFVADIAGGYRFGLIVNDGANNSSPSEVLITAISNTPPIANAGENQQVDGNKTVQLDGSDSFDPDGTTLTWLWTFVTKPEGSNATLNNYAIPNPNFRPDKSGLYTLRLQVSDGIATSTADVQIVVNPSNSITSLNSDMSMVVYPNPFGSKLYVDTDFAVEGKVSFELYTLNGALIERIEEQVSGKISHQLRFDQSKLTNGIYMLMVKTEEKAPQFVRLTYLEKSNQ